MSSEIAGALVHLPTHKTIWPRCIFDTECPRCCVIHKVVKLRRRSVANGATPSEALTAFAMAQSLIDRYALSGAEIRDRLYTSPTSPLNIDRPSRSRRRSTLQRLEEDADEI